MPKQKIRRNDMVKVLTGSDRGKTGRVLRVFPDKDKVLVEHVRVVKKTVSSKSGQRTKGGIAEQEAPIHISNVALVDAKK
jgi:large subunit ribosomal protein L24